MLAAAADVAEVSGVAGLVFVLLFHVLLTNLCDRVVYR